MTGSPPLVGRGQAQEWLEARLRDADAGRPHLALLEGPGGIGKTRLHTELRILARGLGHTLCGGRCNEDGDVPYAPFESLLELLRIEAAGFGAAFPASSGASSAAHDGAADTALWVQGVVHAVIRLARRKTLVILLDDLQRMDEASLRLFAQLVYATGDAAMEGPVRLLLCANFRPVGDDHPLARVLDRVRREPVSELFEVGGLTTGDTYALLRGLGIEYPSEQLATTLMACTGGVPLLLIEAVRTLERDGALIERGGQVMTTVSADALELAGPGEGLAAHAAVDALGTDARELLATASFLGEAFSLRVLAEVTGKSVGDLLAQLEPALDTGVLVEETDRIHFAHPALRRRLYSERGTGSRRRMHLRIATVLQNAHPNGADRYALEIASHLAEAGSAADPRERATHAGRAGDRLMALGASSRAARFFEVALESLVLLPQADPLERAELHFRAGLAYYRVADAGLALHHLESAEAAYGEASDEAGSAQVRCEITRSRYTLGPVTYGGAIETTRLEAALEKLQDNPVLQGRIACVLSDVAWTAVDPQRAIDMGREALRFAALADDPPLKAEGNRCLALAHIQNLEVREALRCYEDGLGVAQEMGHTWLTGSALQRIPLVLFWLGRTEEARGRVREATHLLAQTGDWAGHSHTVAVDTLLAVADGDFDAAERRCRETMTMIRRSGYPWGGLLALQGLACARASQGHVPEALDALDALLQPGRVLEEPGPGLQVLVTIYRYMLTPVEDLDPDLPQQLIAMTRGLPSAFLGDTHAVSGFCALLEIGHRMQRPDLVELAIPVLERASREGLIVTSGWVFLIHRCLAAGAALLGRETDAVSYFETALAHATRIGAHPELARTALEYGSLLASREDPESRSRARRLVSQARRGFRELGMAPGLRDAERAAAELGIVEEGGRANRDTGELSSTERALLREAIKGRPFDEIAEDLLLHPDTVQAWVDRLLEGIGRSAGPIRGEPGLLVLLVTDLEGFTSMTNTLGDQQSLKLMRLHNAHVRDSLAHHGGREVTHTGDGFITSFATAGNAIDCALAIQAVLAAERARDPDFTLRVRIGLHAGEPLPEEGRLLGAALNAAVRICSHANADRILVSDVVRQLATGRPVRFQERGRFRLKGFTDRFHLFEVEGDPK